MITLLDYTIRDVYLEKLAAFASLYAEVNAVYLSGLSPDSAEYAAYFGDHKKLLEMTNLFAVQYLMMEYDGSLYPGRKIVEMSYDELLNLTFDMGCGMEFYENGLMNYEFMKHVTMELLWKSIEWEGKWRLDQLQAIYDQMANYDKNVITKYIIDKLEDDAAKFTFSKEGKEAYDKIKKVFDYSSGKIEVNEKWDEANRQEYYSWFGTGFTYTVADVVNGESYVVQSGESLIGMYNPKVIREVRNWEENGIASWDGVDSDRAKETEQKIQVLTEGSEIIKKQFGENANNFDEIIADLNGIINGGYSISDEDDFLKVKKYTAIVESLYNSTDNSGLLDDKLIIKAEWIGKFN